VLFRKSKNHNQKTASPQLIKLSDDAPVQKHHFLNKVRSFVSSHQLLSFALAFALIGGLIILKSFALEPGGSWSSNSELIKSNQLPAPSQIYQIDLAYDSTKSPQLTATTINLVSGYDLTKDDPNGDYALVLTDKSDNNLKSVKFAIPSKPRAEDLRPNSHFATDVVLNNIDFSLTVKVVPKAVNYKILDKTGNNVSSGQLNVAQKQQEITKFSMVSNNLSAISSSLTSEKSSSKGGAKKGVVITFVSDGYTSAQLGTFHNDVNTFKNKILSLDPFNTSSNLSFAYVDNVKNIGCHYDPKITRVFVCDPKLVKKTIGGTPYTKIYVIHNVNGDESKYGGAAMGIGVDLAAGYNGQYGSSVFSHEMSHLFGLYDEYYYPSDGKQNNPLDRHTHANCFAGSYPPDTPIEWAPFLHPLVIYPGCDDVANWYSSSECSLMKEVGCFYYNDISKIYLKGNLALGGVPDTVPPSKVRNLKAPVISNSQVNLIWSPSTDNVAVSAYDIYRKDLMHGDFERIDTIASIDGVAPTYTDAGVSQATRYTYYVAAIDPSSNTSTGNDNLDLATTGTDSIKPTPPTGFSSSVLSDSQIKLSWRASTDNLGVTAYIIKRNGNQVFKGNALTYTDTGLLALTQYTYSVFALDAAGLQSDFVSGQTELKATTLEKDIISPTTPPSMSSKTISSSQIDVSWGNSSDNRGVKGYDLYRNGSKLTSVNGTSYSDTGLSPNTLYNYYVVAFDAAGNKSGASGSSGSITNPASGNHTENTCFDDGGGFAHIGNCSSGEHGAGYNTGPGCYTPSNSYLYKGQCTS
jgi:chitodextrinase